MYIQHAYTRCCVIFCSEKYNNKRTRAIWPPALGLITISTLWRRDNAIRLAGNPSRFRINSFEQYTCRLGANGVFLILNTIAVRTWNQRLVDTISRAPDAFGWNRRGVTAVMVLTRATRRVSYHKLKSVPTVSLKRHLKRRLSKTADGVRYVYNH